MATKLIYILQLNVNLVHVLPNTSKSRLGAFSSGMLSSSQTLLACCAHLPFILQVGNKGSFTTFPPPSSLKPTTLSLQVKMSNLPVDMMKRVQQMSMCNALPHQPNSFSTTTVEVVKRSPLHGRVTLWVNSYPQSITPSMQ